MKKWLIIGAVIVGLLVLFVSPYNGLVRSEEDVKRTWGDVETAYQRRSELIPNLVKTVQGAAEFERSTLEAVMSARAKATQTTIDPAKDRKSTRLNSSHVKISYAVFCLKKKKRYKT